MPLTRHIGLVHGLGNVGIIASERGLVAVEIHAWTTQPPMRHRREPVVEGDHPLIGAVLASLASYVAGRSRDFPIACDFHGLPPTTRAAMEAVRQVPWGQTITYERLAQRIPGGSAPVVRDALARNPMPIVIPCHRALGHGHMGAFVSTTAAKRELLRIERLDCSKVPDPPAGHTAMRIPR